MSMRKIWFDGRLGVLRKKVSQLPPLGEESMEECQASGKPQPQQEHEQLKQQQQCGEQQHCTGSRFSVASTTASPAAAMPDRVKGFRQMKRKRKRMLAEQLDGILVSLVGAECNGDVDEEEHDEQQQQQPEPSAPAPSPAHCSHQPHGRAGNVVDNDEDDDMDDGSGARLRKHTKVTVTGNHRTKQAYIGLHGTVTKSVGPGGWHWLVLSNGEEVRLQRNALTINELPPEEGDDADSNSSPTSQVTDPGQATQPVRLKRLKQLHSITGTDCITGATQQRQLLQSKPARKILRGSMRVNFNRVETSILRRYRRHYHLAEVGPPQSTKAQLASAVARHFLAQTVDEYQVLVAFVDAARRVKV
eukprot:jgi/Chlat1/8392/Chrsp80S07826